MSKPLVGAPIGADVDGIYAGTTTNGQNSPLQLGTTVQGIDGTQYQLVQAGASLMASTRAPNALAIDEDYQARLMTTALAGEGHGLGFAPQAVIADNAFFWARVNGSNFNHRVVASASADTFLRTSVTAGRLATGSTASAVYFPAVLVTAASASTSAGNTVREVLAGRLAAVRAGLAGLP
jgi:hypothetical protein